MSKLYNLAKMTTSTTGTGTITLGSAVSGFLTFAQAGIVDGDIVSYGIVDGSNREVGTGIYTASGTTLTRTVINSTNSNSAITLSGSAVVFITVIASNFSNIPLEQHTASASATLNFTSFISSTYDEYIIEAINIVPATTNQAGWRWAPAGIAFAGGSSGKTAINLDADGGVKSDSTLPFNGTWRLFDPQSTTAKKYITGQAGYVDNSGTIIGTTITGIYLSTTALTAIQFFFSSGNITSGTIRIYGVAK
jgi:hypothetical protein